MEGEVWRTGVSHLARYLVIRQIQFLSFYISDRTTFYHSMSVISGRVFSSPISNSITWHGPHMTSHHMTWHGNIPFFHILKILFTCAVDPVIPVRSENQLFTADHPGPAPREGAKINGSPSSGGAGLCSDQRRRKRGGCAGAGGGEDGCLCCQGQGSRSF